MKTTIRLIVLSLTMTMCLSAYASDKISKVTYKWTDKQGVVQYTERPPTGMVYEKITVTASGGREVVKVVTEEDEETAETGKHVNDGSIESIVKANKRNCVVAKKNLEILTKLNRVKVSDDKGENRILTFEEKQAREDETRKQVEIFCKSS